MTNHLLCAHPDFASPVTRIAVEVVRDTANRLRLEFRLSGALDGVAIPPTDAPERTDQLWRHTCLEAFVGAHEEGYYEYNLSPSGRWAAYRFDAYRAGMRDAAMRDPGIEWRGGDGVLRATIALPGDARGALGLSAIIEDVHGNRSFWALAHPAGPPDFHDATCFTAELPPAG